MQIEIIGTTVLIAFIPTIIFSILYLLLFINRGNKFVELFLTVLGLNAVTFVLFTILTNTTQYVGPFDPSVNNEVLVWTLFTDALFQFGNTMQTMFTWIMISLFAIPFSILILSVKLSLQDPLKRKFKNVIRKITKKEPELDGFSGFRDRIGHLEFEKVPQNPIEAGSIKDAWKNSWKDYAKIGFATLVPVMMYFQSVMYNLLTIPGYAYDVYAFNIILFATWIYRFGYPSGNRLAKGAGLKLGDKKVGDEMMKGTLGWFFKLNLACSIISIILTIINFPSDPILVQAWWNSITISVGLALPPIFYAIIILPVSEQFIEILYKRVYDVALNMMNRITGISFKSTLKTIIIGAFSGVVIMLIMVGGIIAVTVNYSAFIWPPNLLPGQIIPEVSGILMGGVNNSVTISAKIWLMSTLLIPIGGIILLAVVLHYLREYFNLSLEVMAVVASITAALGIWYILPGLDYVIGTLVTEVNYNGIMFQYLRPWIADPSTSGIFTRAIAQFLLNVPMYIAVVIVIMYYLYFSKRTTKMKDSDSVVISPNRNDFTKVIKMFFGGIIMTFLAILILSLFMDIQPLKYFFNMLISEIGSPEGLEAFLVPPRGPPQFAPEWFILFAEHNILRTLLMLVLGPLVWLILLYFISSQKKMAYKSAFAIGISLFMVAEYFIWDDQFSFIAISLLALILTPIYRMFSEDGKKDRDILTTFIKMSIISIPVAEILSTALWVGGGMAIHLIAPESLSGGGVFGIEQYIYSIMVHGIIEIPAFLLCASLSFRILREIEPPLNENNTDEFIDVTKNTLLSGGLWRTYFMFIFFIIIAALIEAFITPWFVMMSIQGII